MKFLTSLLPVFLPFVLFAQIPGNDLCSNAIELEIGEILQNQHNQAATISEGEIPEGMPRTCIETFENDLWYQFQTIPEYSHYRVAIRPGFCNTPAGLQALIIRSDSCQPEQFRYVACANPYATEDLDMVIRENEPGTNFLIYVDGFDGTECGFLISLEGFERDPRSPEELANEQHDYNTPPPSFEPGKLDLSFENNGALIRWTAKSQEDVEFFVVQIAWMKNYDNYSYIHGKSLGKILPINTAGSQTEIDYEFEDFREFLPGEEYCYRIVKISSSGEKSYSTPICRKAELNEDFFISPVFKGELPGQYVVQFQNFKKQDLRFSVMDQEREVQKSLLRAKEPKGDGIITIDMSDYSEGKYYLKVEGKEEYFVREFSIK